MNAEIIAVGSELLLGQIANTNGQFLSKHLAEIGINVFFHSVVGDNETRLQQSIIQAKSRADLIILTGGLGPTKDDLTKDTVAKLVNKPLVYDENSLHNMEKFFKRSRTEISEQNLRQALVIEDATVFINQHGLAPGMAFQSEGFHYILLPGPPKEMEPMVISYVKPYLQQMLGSRSTIYSRVLRFFNIGESEIETRLKDLIDGQTNPTIAPLAADGEVTIRLTAKAMDAQEASKEIDRVEKIILDRVGSFFYGYDNTSLMEQVIQILLEKKITIAAAESLTGGLFSEQLTAFSGVSEIFNGSIVSYKNVVKENVLNVAKETIVNDGVISEQCAKEMAMNVRNICQSDIGISFTGVAGPSKQEGKEIGTVFVGISLLEEEPIVIPLKLRGSRQQIRLRAVKNGCFYLLKELKRWN